MIEAIRGVIDAIVRNRRKFETFCYSLSDAQLGRRVPDSTWLVRDFAAHLGTLDTALMRWFGAVPATAGGAPTQAVGEDGTLLDVDAFNDAQVAERRSWPLDRIFAEASDNRAKLIELLSSLTQEQFDSPMHFGGDAKRPAGDLPLGTFLAGWAQHDPIHVADMVKALPELQTDEELAAWLNSPFVRGYQALMNRPGHG